MGQRREKEEPQDPSVFKRYRPLITEDLAILRNLSQRLAANGALAKEEGQLTHDDVEMQTFFTEATDGAKYEKQLNTKHYHVELENLVREKELQMEDFDNPSLDGIDDYGRQMYEDRRTSDKESVSDSQSSTIEELKKNFEARGINTFDQSVYSKHTPVKTLDAIKEEE